jgi:hypothetical protein
VISVRVTDESVFKTSQLLLEGEAFFFFGKPVISGHSLQGYPAQLIDTLQKLSKDRLSSFEFYRLRTEMVRAFKLQQTKVKDKSQWELFISTTQNLVQRDTYKDWHRDGEVKSLKRATCSPQLSLVSVPWT